LKDKAFSTFLDQNPLFELRRENGISPPAKAGSANGPSSTTTASSDKRKANCRRAAQPNRRPAAELMVVHPGSGPTLQFSSAVDVMKEP
jgi:hypothetical protein